MPTDPPTGPGPRITRTVYDRDGRIVSQTDLTEQGMRTMAYEVAEGVTYQGPGSVPDRDGWHIDLSGEVTSVDFGARGPNHRSGPDTTAAPDDGPPDEPYIVG